MLRFPSRKHAEREDRLEAIRDATGVFMTGGDQMRLGTKLGADRDGAAGWIGKGIRGAGSGMRSGAAATRDGLGLDEDGNDFTGHIDIPEDSEEHTQQYSELGLPITADAWAMQNDIDGGKLQDTYDRTLVAALQRVTEVVCL